jgi:hypothetical protein
MLSDNGIRSITNKSTHRSSIKFLLRIDLEMIDPFNISLDIRDRGWVSEAEPHPHKFDEFNGAPFGSAQGTPFQWIIFYMDYP